MPLYRYLHKENILADMADGTMSRMPRKRDNQQIGDRVRLFSVRFFDSILLKGTSGLCVRFLKNVDGQGTQAIIKNLNLKKLKRFWNQNFIEVNDYTV